MLLQTCTGMTWSRGGDLHYQSVPHFARPKVKDTIMYLLQHLKSGLPTSHLYFHTRTYRIIVCIANIFVPIRCISGPFYKAPVHDTTRLPTYLPLPSKQLVSSTKCI